MSLCKCPDPGTQGTGSQISDTHARTQHSGEFVLGAETIKNATAATYHDNGSGHENVSEHHGLHTTHELPVVEQFLNKTQDTYMITLNTAVQRAAARGETTTEGKNEHKEAGENSKQQFTCRQGAEAYKSQTKWDAWSLQHQAFAGIFSSAENERGQLSRTDCTRLQPACHPQRKNSMITISNAPHLQRCFRCTHLRNLLGGHEVGQDNAGVHHDVDNAVEIKHEGRHLARRVAHQPHHNIDHHERRHSNLRVRPVDDLRESHPSIVYHDFLPIKFNGLRRHKHPAPRRHARSASQQHSTHHHTRPGAAATHV